MKILLLGLLLFVGCAEKSGVYSSGENTYSISNQAATGFSGLQDIKSEAYEEASLFCKQKNQDFKVINVESTKPPYILGNYPRVDLQFKCITKYSSQ
ncbi:MAG: hypothetical protein PHZ17_07040 [Sulfurovum sp.]|nr:hypothetical protein [Sulfurovum sp.]